MKQQYDKCLGKQVREIRKKKKLTQEQLAAKLQTSGCDITRSALAKIEAGQRHVYTQELRALKKVLSVSYERLLK